MKKCSYFVTCDKNIMKRCSYFIHTTQISSYLNQQFNSKFPSINEVSIRTEYQPFEFDISIDRRNKYKDKITSKR